MNDGMDTSLPLLLPIITIDDDPDDLFFITRRISRSGIKNPIVTLTSGSAAISHMEKLLREASNASPCIAAVFCDIKMPEMNGFEVLRWFRSKEPCSRTPFYILSGSNEPVDKATAVGLGANGYLVKFPAEAIFAEIINTSNRAIESDVMRCGS